MTRTIDTHTHVLADATIKLLQKEIPSLNLKLTPIDGDLIGKIPVPEKVANVCFGGLTRDRLYICGHTSLYAIHVNARGAQAP